MARGPAGFIRLTESTSLSRVVVAYGCHLENRPIQQMSNAAGSCPFNAEIVLSDHENVAEPAW